ncbi:MAG: hypothetical protein HC881_14035 [Leptolyngbyaceae cyanobacterium SL_7_1]|nr:hypothetical protein [Leptolyngbyaceae cyanobacterium SL_7_1]
MKFKWMVALIGGVAAIGFTVAPFVGRAYAQDALPPILEVMEQLNLTDTQRTQLEQIWQETRAEMEAILSVEQREQFRSTFENGGNFREAAAAMNLTDEQRTELRSIMSSTRDEAAAVLTDEQRQELRETLRDRMQQDRPGAGMRR